MSSLRAPVRPPTAPSRLRWVLLGATPPDQTVYRTLEEIQHIPTPDDPVLPVLIACSPREARDYLSADAVLQRVKTLSPARILKSLHDLPWPSDERRVFWKVETLYAIAHCEVPQTMRLIVKTWPDAFLYLDTSAERDFIKPKSLYDALLYFFFLGKPIDVISLAEAEEEQEREEARRALEEQEQEEARRALEAVRIRNDDTPRASTRTRTRTRTRTTAIVQDDTRDRRTNDDTDSRLDAHVRGASSSQRRAQLSPPSASQQSREVPSRVSRAVSTQSQAPSASSRDSVVPLRASASVGTETRRRVIISHLRDTHGGIRGAIYADRDPLDADGPDPGEVVPSLGPELDRMLDTFGMESTLITKLHRARTRYSDKRAFVHLMSEEIPISEADWYYDQIVVYPETLFRCRTVRFTLN